MEKVSARAVLEEAEGADDEDEDDDHADGDSTADEDAAIDAEEDGAPVDEHTIVLHNCVAWPAQFAPPPNDRS